MDNFWYTLSTWLMAKKNDGWLWFNALSRQEWLILLALVTLLGFSCMRGYGSRHNY